VVSSPSSCLLHCDPRLEKTSFLEKVLKVFKVFLKVLGKIFGGRPGSSSFGKQQRLSEITIEPIKNLGAWVRFGGPVPPSLKPPHCCQIVQSFIC